MFAGTCLLEDSNKRHSLFRSFSTLSTGPCISSVIVCACMCYRGGEEGDGDEVIVREEGMDIVTPQKSLYIPCTARMSWRGYTKTATSEF